MKNLRISFVFWQYLKRCRHTILAIMVFTAIFSVLFGLNGVPQALIVYGLILFTFFGLIFLSFGCVRYYRRHIQLVEKLRSIRTDLDNMPEPGDLIEADYHNLIREMNREIMRIALEADNTRSDMTDYYTMWVHQIKTPIAAMRLLLQTKELDENVKCGQELQSELFKIEQYVEMVLQYLRIDSDQTDYVIKLYNLDDIVRQAVKKYARLFIMKKIKLNYEPLDISVITDEKWLLFVVEQILSNSLKYTKTGSISIYSRGRELVIEDTGIGIAPEDIVRVFEKGYTGYNGRADKKSTGIGLYLCRRIMKTLSHAIFIESEEGKGTRVILKFQEEQAH